MTAALAAILDELGIAAVSAHDYRGANETMAVECMERILRQYGYAHLKMVLMSVVDSERPENARELVGPVIWAISDLIRAHPTWAASASRWFEVFDAIQLGELRAVAKLNKRATRQRAALATLLFGYLLSQFEPQGRLF